MLAVVLISAFAFMVFTASKMLVTRQAKLMLGDTIPVGYSPISYLEKSTPEQKVRHLTVHMDEGEGYIGLIDVYEIQDEKAYAHFSKEEPYVVMMAAMKRLEEDNKTGDEFSNWQHFGSVSECETYVVSHKTQGLLPFSMVFKKEPEQHRVQVLLRAGEAIDQNTEASEESPEAVMYQLNEYCKHLKKLLPKREQ